MLLFVIYAHFSKICRNYVCAFNFKFSVEKYPNNKQIHGKHIYSIYI